MIYSLFQYNVFCVFCCILGPPDKPRHVSVVSKSHNSITVGWEVGLNGGSEQYFKILYREKGNKAYQESRDNITGLKSGQSINYTIHGLSTNVYEITVVAINLFGNRSQSAGDMQEVITEGMTLKVKHQLNHLDGTLLLFL